MSIMQPDPQACSMHLFGSQAIGDSLTLADITTFLGNYQGPPGIEPGDTGEIGPDDAAPPGARGAPSERPPMEGPKWERNPSGLVTIVEGWVRATIDIADGGPETPAAVPPPSKSPATLTAAAPVKLRVSSAQYSAPFTIDSDRRIDIPSPHACVDVLAPDGWISNPAPTRVLQVDGGDLVWNVWLQVKICRAQTQSNYAALLTEQFNAAAGATTFTVRPRAARRLHITSDVVGAIDFAMFQGPGPNFNAGLLRRTLGGVVDLGPLPDFTHIRCPAIANGPRITYCWDVVP